MRLYLIVAGLWVALAACAWSQMPTPQAAAVLPQNQHVDLQAQLKRLAATAESLQHDLPSFSCRENGLSQVVKKGKVKTQVQFAGDLRVQRGPDGRLHERLQTTEVNGKPLSGNTFKRPIFVEGGFDESLDYFLPAEQGCFHFVGSAGRVDFQSPPGSFDRPACVDMGAPNGFVLLDSADRVTHIERTVPSEYANQVSVVDFSGIDFIWTELDGTMYPLSAKMVAEVPKGDETLHFEATYSGCHLFKATSTVLPGATPVTDDTPALPHP
jgi:hypothetical protein